ncbi:cobalamin-dependent protein [Desulfallas sp. Bu1-1]|uniref:B12-binding domain-containing radical SAM protein n=1 Tax=Desulfallas sp. Bu1-1 TaxID=2787620 RepID=UPI00189F784D|nr:radical SAM protein [Desulfallas sp. Bu1-1]MBF7082582.1 cobalamin-dependent protein [Desulfallas sp. Bu1-1]
MRVLLVQPRPVAGMGYKSTIAVEPLGLEIVGAALGDHNVRLLDMLANDNITVAVQEFRPAAVGISCSFTVDVYRTLELAQEAKAANKDIFVFVGGHHASLSPEDFRHPAVDAVVVGEGETTVPELIAALEGGGDPAWVAGLVLNMREGQFFTGERPLLQRLDDVPRANRDLTDRYRDRYFLGLRRPFVTLETARGCPYRCNFCSIWRFYRGKVRSMSPERVVEEVERLPAGDVLFTDDNFLADVRRAERIASLLKSSRLPKRRYIIQARSDTIMKHPEIVRQWKEIGLDQVFIGFEKIDQSGMELVNKQNSVENNEKALSFLKSIGVGVYASFIVDPGFSSADFQKLLHYIKKLRIEQPQFSILTPLPGTELFQQLKSRLTTKNCEQFDLLHAVLPTRLPLVDFYKEFTRLYRKAYFCPGHTMGTLRWFLQKFLTGRLSWEHLRRLLSGVRQTLDYRSYLGKA